MRAKHKARLVAKGYTQKKGLDYGEKFTPVIKMTTIRLMLALAASMDWEIKQYDIVTAFLNGELDEEIYMAAPEGFSHMLPPGKCYRVKRSLYGLVQAPRQFNEKAVRTLAALGLQQLKSDPCLFTSFDNSIFIAVIIYVDDLLMFSNSAIHMEDVEKHLEGVFDIKKLGDPKVYLGLEIRRDRSKREIKISQTRYITEMIDRYGLSTETTGRQITTPMTSDDLTNLVVTESDRQEMKNIPYLSLIGSLLYASNGSRPDISYAVSLLARFSTNPHPRHWQAAKRVLRYLRLTTQYHITYAGTSGQIAGYVDTDLAGDSSDRKSTTGYIYTICGGAVSWSSKKQPTVADSTCEAEYIALASAAKEACWLRSVLSELRFGRIVITIYEDNMSTISISYNPVHHGRTKHIDIKYHFIREKIKDNELAVVHIPTWANAADMLTKVLVRDRHQSHIVTIGMS